MTQPACLRCVVVAYRLHSLDLCFDAVENLLPAAGLQMPPSADTVDGVAGDPLRFQRLAGEALAGRAIGPGVRAGDVDVRGNHRTGSVGIGLGRTRVEAVVIPAGALQATDLPAPGRGELLDAVVALGG